MPGPATYASDVNVASRARAMLDEIAESVETMERGQREVVRQLLALWPISGWKAAGVRSAKAWLHAHTDQSWNEAARLERIARLCASDDSLADAVVSGRFPLGWADTLSRAVTDERAPFLTPDVIGAMVDLAKSGVTDDTFGDIVRYWKERADEHLKPRRVQPHSLVASQRLFGGGEIHASLSPVAFETVMGAIDAFCQDPDPADAPYQRTFSERRADALDDLAHFGLTHGGDGDQGCGLSPDDQDEFVDDVFDGTTPDDTTVLDELLNDHDHDNDDHGDGDGDDTGDGEEESHQDQQGIDELEALRRHLRKQVFHRWRRARRQTRPRSGARVNVHIDLHTLANLRNIDDLDGLVLRGEGWSLAHSAAEQFLCDSSLAATLFAGRRVLDANADAEHFSNRQRRAIAARDRYCVFPGCRRPPRHCDAHHLHERDDGGPTVVANGCLLCRFHHRLLHQYKWKLRQDDDGWWIATDPHGNEWTERRPTDAAAG